jgi:hypothetical protein
MRRALANTDNQRESTQETRDFYPVVRPSNTCLLPRCGIPMDEGCTQPLSSDPMINLNTTAFFLIVFLLFARNLHNLEPLALTMMITKEAQKQGRGEQHTQESNQQHNHAHKSQIELEVQHTEFATQLELKSLTQRIKCVESESGSLRMFLVSLCTSSMRLGVPFIAPRQLGAVGGQTCLLSGGAPERDLLPFLAHPTVGPRGRLAHRTVRCTPDSPVCPTDRCCGPRVARGLRGRPLVLAIVGSPDSPVQHRTVW